jgi:molybdate transport system substrate-binding protein
VGEASIVGDRTGRFVGTNRDGVGPRAGLLAVVLLMPLTVGCGPRPALVEPHGGEPLVVACAASTRGAMEAIMADYARATGTAVVAQYGPSQSLLAGIEVAGSRSADLFLPADDGFLDVARQRGLVGTGYPLAEMRPVIAVPRGNPRGIAALDDLLAADVRLALANPDATAIGRVVRAALQPAGRWQPLADRTTVVTTTVTEAATAVKLGSVDAAIVYDALLHDFDTLEGVAVPELADVVSRVAIAVVEPAAAGGTGAGTAPARTAAAHRFARFCAARDRGLVHYRGHGFVPADGDPWDPDPELVLYAGSMLRPAIEETVAAFEAREGVRVNRVYNGCGILVAQMRAGRVPDAYFACDSEFMGQVRDLFPQSRVVSQNELVIIVAKGNPHRLGGLADLTRPGLRVGIGHEKQCAMGWLTQRTFAEAGLESHVMENVVVQTPTGDMLVNQMRGGSLDAAVVYLSNAAGSGDVLDAVRIDGLPCSIASQPYGVAAGSVHRGIAARLQAAIETAESREIFEAEGFRWLGDGPATGAAP